MARGLLGDARGEPLPLRLREALRREGKDEDRVCFLAAERCPAMVGAVAPLSTTGSSPQSSDEHTGCRRDGIECASREGGDCWQSQRGSPISGNEKSTYPLSPIGAASSSLTEMPSRNCWAQTGSASCTLGAGPLRVVTQAIVAKRHVEAAAIAASLSSEMVSEGGADEVQLGAVVLLAESRDALASACFTQTTGT